MELQVLDAAFERHDPAIEERFGTHHLAAEIVDEEYSTERFDMQRRLVKSGARIEFQVEHLEVELTTRHDKRSQARYPAAVEALAANDSAASTRVDVALSGAVDARIENLDDLAFDLEAI